MVSSNVPMAVMKELGVYLRTNLHVPTSSATQDASTPLMDQGVTATMDINWTWTRLSVWTSTNANSLEFVAKTVPILMAALPVPVRKDMRRM